MERYNNHENKAVKVKLRLLSVDLFMVRKSCQNWFLQEQVWGVAYEIYKEDIESVCKHLDHREKDGYQRQLVTFYHPRVENG